MTNASFTPFGTKLLVPISMFRAPVPLKLFTPTIVPPPDALRSVLPFPKIIDWPVIESDELLLPTIVLLTLNTEPPSAFDAPSNTVPEVESVFDKPTFTEEVEVE